MFAANRLRTDRLALLLLLGAVALVYFPTAANNPLTDDGEALYAHVAQQMIARGDWVTPYANGTRFLDKPPLLYWLTALSYLLFGMTEFAARLPSALAVLGTVWIVFGLGLRAGGQKAGLAAGTATAFCVGTFLFSRMVYPDMLLVFFITLALAAFHGWYQSGKKSLGLALLFYAALAAAALTKGLIGIVFPVATVLLLAAWRRDLKCLWRFHPGTGIAVFLLLAVPWHAMVALRNEGFLWHYFVNEHILRFVGRRQPQDYDSIGLLAFWALILLWMFPWSVFLPAACFLRRSSVFKGDTQATVELAVAWAGVEGLFFSFSSRIEHYSLPILPPLALLIGVVLAVQGRPDLREDSTVDRWVARGFGVLGALGIILALVLLASGRLDGLIEKPGFAVTSSPRLRAYGNYFEPLFDFPRETLLRLVPLVRVLAGGLGLGLILAWWMNRRRLRTAAALVLSASMAIFCFCAYNAVGICGEVLSSRAFAKAILDRHQPGARVIVAGDFETANSVDFYADTVLEVYGGSAATIQAGLQYPDSPHIILNRRELLERWHAAQRVFLIAADAEVPLLGLSPTRVLLRSAGRTLLSNR